MRVPNIPALRACMQTCTAVMMKKEISWNARTTGLKSSLKGWYFNKISWSLKIYHHSFFCAHWSHQKLSVTIPGESIFQRSHEMILIPATSNLLLSNVIEMSGEHHRRNSWKRLPWKCQLFNTPFDSKRFECTWSFRFSVTTSLRNFHWTWYFSIFLFHRGSRG